MSLNPKAKMRIRLAVTDYQQMFPEDYKNLLRAIEEQKQNLKTDYAEITETRGGSDMRALFTIDERLSAMIGMKLTHDDLVEFKTTEACRWFAKEYPQFAITKEV